MSAVFNPSRRPVKRCRRQKSSGPSAKCSELPFGAVFWVAPLFSFNGVSPRVAAFLFLSGVTLLLLLFVVSLLLSALRILPWLVFFSSSVGHAASPEVVVSIQSQAITVALAGSATYRVSKRALHELFVLGFAENGSCVDVEAVRRFADQMKRAREACQSKNGTLKRLRSSINRLNTSLKNARGQRDSLRRENTTLRIELAELKRSSGSIEEVTPEELPIEQAQTLDSKEIVSIPEECGKVVTAIDEPSEEFCRSEEEEMALSGLVRPSRSQRYRALKEEPGRILWAFVKAKIPAKAFSRTIRCLAAVFLFNGSFTPCPNSLVNWALRASLSLLRKRTRFQRTKHLQIMDHCIKVGNIKVFCVLAVTNETFRAAMAEKRPPSLRDLQMVHLGFDESSNAHSVADTLDKLHKETGTPVFAVSDQGSDLVAGIRELNRRRAGRGQARILAVQDITHVAANALKAKYEPMNWLKNLLASLASARARLTNSKDAWIRPASLNTRMRFFNMRNVLKQCEAFLKGINSAGDSNEQRLLRKYFLDLKKHEKRMIPAAIKTFDTVFNVITILKKQGLSQESAELCRTELRRLHSGCKVRVRMEEWITCHLKMITSARMKGWKGPIPVTSDAIESLFSQLKTIMGRNANGDPSKMAVLICLYAGDHSADELGQMIRETSHKQAADWVESNIPESIQKKRVEAKFRNRAGGKKSAGVLKSDTHKSPPKRVYVRATQASRA